MAAAASPFDVIGTDTSGPVRPSRYRRPSGGRWKGPAIVLSVVVVTAAVAFFCWPYVRNALQEPQQASTQPDQSKKDDPKSPRMPVDIAKPNKDPKEPGGKSDDPANPANDPSTTDKPKPRSGDTPKPDDPKKIQYPRRALVISVHNYLYANPVHAGISGASARNLAHFPEALNKGLHISLNEIAQLSDIAGKGQARTP